MKVGFFFDLSKVHHEHSDQRFNEDGRMMLNNTLKNLEKSV